MKRVAPGLTIEMTALQVRIVFGVGFPLAVIGFLLFFAYFVLSFVNYGQ